MPIRIANQRSLMEQAVRSLVFHRLLRSSFIIKPHVINIGRAAAFATQAHDFFQFRRRAAADAGGGIDLIKTRRCRTNPRGRSRLQTVRCRLRQNSRRFALR